MALIVQKYGGTSVGNIERIHRVADRVEQTQRQGHQVVVVLSAMSGETDRLIKLAHEATANPDDRELDMLLSTGERVTIALASFRWSPDFKASTNNPMSRPSAAAGPTCRPWP
jgi:aspartate kinase